MAYTMPTAGDLTARYPEFASVEAPDMDLAMLLAATAVGENWSSQSLYSTGALLYAAHLLTLWGRGDGAEAQGARAGTLGVSSVSDGGVSITRDPGHGDGNALDLTIYGRQYRSLLRRAVVAVVACGDPFKPSPKGSPW